MGKRLEPTGKKTPEILVDLLAGHTDAVRDGPDAARRYLENALQYNRSMPNAVKFFTLDLLASACADLGIDERRDEALALAWQHLEAAQADTGRQLTEYLPTAKMFDVGLRAAVDIDDIETAVLWCDRAIALGLGRAFERKAENLRRRL